MAKYCYEEDVIKRNTCPKCKKVTEAPHVVETDDYDLAYKVRTEGYVDTAEVCEECKQKKKHNKVSAIIAVIVVIAIVAVVLWVSMTR